MSSTKYNQESNSADEAFSAFAGWMLLFIQMVVLGLWLVSAWLTKLLIEHVLDPITNWAFSRNDGLVIICSTLLWGMIFPFLLLPVLAVSFSQASLVATLQILIGTVLLGLAWGVSVGVKVLIDLWLEIPNQSELAYNPAQVLAEPVRLTTSSNGSMPRQPLPARKELEAELEEVYGNGVGKAS